MPSSEFRIAHTSLARRSLNNLQDNLTRLARVQDEVSSMKKLRKPSDSPVDTVSAMRLRSDMGRNEQISRNLDDAMGWLGVADNAITSTVEQLARVRDLAIQARNASSDSVARGALASEVEKIRESILGLANTQFNGRAVFGGTASTTAAYDSSATYVGFSSVIERTIAPGVRVQVNVNGDDLFGTPGDDLFGELTLLANAIRTNPADLDTLVTDLDTRTTTVQTRLGEVGARFNRVETMKDRNSADALTMKQNLSNVEDTDMAQVLMELRMQEVAYQAALQATARAIQPSLIDFLR
ncbi:MAG: flagellar hook-associated protein FlgL [Actinomycetota bacterium]|nr:flagellar hook-associated protein FlgL [Actinomycetota bacterium]